jgi:hypothetical protein
MRLELRSLKVNQLLLTVRKQRGVAGGARLELSLGETNTQRTDLALLPADRHRTYPIQQLNN